MSDEDYMKRCLELAKKGQPACYPNPMVGCVIVHEGRIIGEGYHQKYGSAHAEVNAINSVSKNDQKFLKESILYVNLEPCDHHGNTPPCSEKIIETGIPIVKIGSKDPHKDVSGKGIEKLLSADIEVETDILKDDCNWHNRRFFTFHQKNRPYVILKMAVTADGYMDIDRNKQNVGIHWITSPEFQSISHQWRSEEAAIIIGHNTLVNDNPSLTVRAYHGQNPKRFVITKNGKINSEYKLMNDTDPVCILNERIEQKNEEIEWISIQSLNPDTILRRIHDKSIISVIVEGGSSTLQKFIDHNLWDEARVITSNEVNIIDGQLAPAFNGHAFKIVQLTREKIDFIKNNEL